ncbi:MAG TPA: glycosyltransferase family A protein [Candidatus Acidoferrales bacterium]|nr:glycosyltransferase family A protein [Candidatus Acidoferrales bacterium]
MPPQVTAILPVYNGAALLRRSIESALGQTRPPAELIVVDDGSTDATSRIARSYGSRIHYFHQPNRGAAAARNFGAQQAATEWIAFLDHDDEWLPEKLECQLPLLEQNPAARLAYSAFWSFALDGSCRREHLPLRRLWPTIRLRNPFPPSVVIVRRSEFLALGGFNETLRGASCEDWEFLARFLAAHPAAETAEPLTNYYETAASGSRDYRRMLPNTLSIVENPLLSGLSPVGRAFWRRRIKSAVYYRAAVSAREAGDPAARYLWQSFLEWPFPDVSPQRFKTMAVQLFKHRPSLSA